jgi:hypothetical protein
MAAIELLPSLISFFPFFHEGEISFIPSRLLLASREIIIFRNKLQFENEIPAKDI